MPVLIGVCWILSFITFIFLGSRRISLKKNLWLTFPNWSTASIFKCLIITISRTIEQGLLVFAWPFLNKDRIKHSRLLYYYRNHDINKIKNKEIKEILLNKIIDEKRLKHNDYLKEPLLCNDCSTMISRRHIARHNRSNKHIKNSLSSVSSE